MKRGGGWYLVYGSSSSSYVDGVVNFVDECLLIDDLGFVCPRLRLLIFGSSIYRLSFVLGEFSFWLGFGLCLTILLVPWGCRRAYRGPHCGCESARVLASLLGPSPSGVRHLSRVCSSVGGPVGVAHSFHPSLLLGGGLVRLCGGPC